MTDDGDDDERPDLAMSALAASGLGSSITGSSSTTPSGEQSGPFSQFSHMSVTEHVSAVQALLNAAEDRVDAHQGLD